MIEACRNIPYVITLTNKSDITSPNYPYNYDNNMYCTWFILAGQQSRIEVSVRGELEDGCVKHSLHNFLILLKCIK